MKLTFVTPEKRVVVGQEIDSAIIPSHKGELNILPGHAPLIATLVPGVMKYKLTGGKQFVASISWGYCHISAEGLSVLAESVETPEEIDRAEALKNLQEAEHKLLHKTMADDEHKHVTAQVDHEKARLLAADLKN